MKKIMIAGLSVLLVSAASAQEPQGKASSQELLKQGRVLYDHTIEIKISLGAGASEEMQRMIPKSRSNKLEVLFGNNQSLRRAVPEDIEDENAGSVNGGGLTIRTNVMGANDIFFTDLASGIRKQQTEVGTKTYIVVDTVKRLDWKLTGETKMILNYLCQKATTQSINNRMAMNIVNGVAQQTQVIDTSNIAVWFTTAIPVSAGPEYGGQLPGMILEININNGRDVYKALDVSPKADLAVIKEPKSGKTITRQEYAAERQKLLKDMQGQMKTSGNGNGTFIIRSQE